MELMDTKTGKPRSHSQVALAVGLLLFAAVAMTDAVLYARGTWFASATARVVYRALWSLLWLVGMGLLSMLLVRERRASLGIGLVVVGVALAFTWMAADRFALGRVLGVVGLTLPMLAQARTARTRERLFYLAVLIWAAALMHFADNWSLGALVIGGLCLCHARAIWPAVAKALKDSFREDEQRTKDSKAYRWVERIALAMLIAGLGSVALVFGYAAVLWLRSLGR